MASSTSSRRAPSGDGEVVPSSTRTTFATDAGSRVPAPTPTRSSTSSGISGAGRPSAETIAAAVGVTVSGSSAPATEARSANPESSSSVTGAGDPCGPSFEGGGIGSAETSMRSTPRDSSAAATPTTSNRVSSSPSSSSSSSSIARPWTFASASNIRSRTAVARAAHPFVERRAFDRVEQLPRPASLGGQVTRDRERERPQTLPAHLGGRAPDAAAEHRGHGIGHLVRGRAGVEQRRQEHVARRAADDVDVQDPHRGPLIAE